MPQPRYACCFVWDGDQHYLFEDRPKNGRPAAGRLTCFGGALEAGETALQAIQRELQEELQLRHSGPFVPMVELWVRGAWMARFYRCYLPQGTSLQLEDKVRACWLRSDRIHAHLRLSPWHRACFEALEAGKTFAKSDD